MKGPAYFILNSQHLTNLEQQAQLIQCILCHLYYIVELVKNCTASQYVSGDQMGVGENLQYIALPYRTTKTAFIHLHQMYTVTRHQEFPSPEKLQS